uniref:Uncharacterized protein n=2 Tax=Ciona intestinalis TaxID=7719 RepID=H2XX90_CIOIN
MENQKHIWKSRKLLVDSSVENMCSTHLTGVATGYLAASLRLFYDPYYINNRLALHSIPQILEQIPPKSIPVDTQLTMNITLCYGLLFAFVILSLLVIIKKRKAIFRGKSIII